MKKTTRTILSATSCLAILSTSVGLLTGCAGSEAARLQSEREVSQTSTASSEASSAASQTESKAESKTAATATIGSTGDILIHSTFLGDGDNDGTLDDRSASYYYNASTNTYNFDSIYQYVKSYYQKADYMIAATEVTFCGDDIIDYAGYPLFNCPDAMLTSLHQSGVDMLLTGSNHIADTELYGGFERTQKAIQENGMDFAGTQAKAGDKKYNIVEVNGIKIGITNYVYTSYDSEGNLCINGMPISSDLANRINHFTYDNLDSLYAELKQVLSDMKADGAEATIIYPHWGEEYQLTENSYQDEMAQNMADLGFDAVIGGHPHVVQPTTVLTSSATKQLVPVLFSMGNEVSNQRKELMDTLSDGHTEDGTITYLTFTRNNNGKVTLTNFEILPTWTHMYYSDSGKRVYEIVPLDSTVSDWSVFNLSASDGSLSEAKDSYNRTMALVEDGVKAYNTAMGSSASSTTSTISSGTSSSVSSSKS